MSHVSGRETRYLQALLWVSGSSRPSREEGLGLETGVGWGVSVASRNQVTARSGHHSRVRQAHAALSPGGRRCSPTCAGTPGAIFLSIYSFDAICFVFLFQILFPFRLLQNIGQSSLKPYSRSLLAIYFK